MKKKECREEAEKKEATTLIMGDVKSTSLPTFYWNKEDSLNDSDWASGCILVSHHLENSS